MFEYYYSLPADNKVIRIKSKNLVTPARYEKDTETWVIGWNKRGLQRVFSTDVKELKEVDKDVESSMQYFLRHEMAMKYGDSEHLIAAMKYQEEANYYMERAQFELMDYVETNGL
jgi:hypothetical protein